MSEDDGYWEGREDMYREQRAEIERLTAENERLRADLAEFSRLKEYAKSLGQETYLELHAKNERLKEALEIIDSTPVYSDEAYALQNFAKDALNRCG